MAALAPMPTARVTTATAATPGRRATARRPCRRSRRSSLTVPPAVALETPGRGKTLGGSTPRLSRHDLERPQLEPPDHLAGHPARDRTVGQEPLQVVDRRHGLAAEADNHVAVQK